MSKRYFILGSGEMTRQEVEAIARAEYGDVAYKLHRTLLGWEVELEAAN